MTNYCNNCGKLVNPDDIFCNNCGTQTSDSKTVTTPKDHPSRQFTTLPRLYRSVDDRWVAGVCGGLGRHLNIDPILIRIAFIIGIMMGIGLVIYIILAIFIEEETRISKFSPSNTGKPQY